MLFIFKRLFIEQFCNQKRLKVVKTIIFLHFFVGYLNYYSQISFFAKKFNYI